MSIVVCTYLVYTLVSVALTYWVARTLSGNGVAFLIDAMDGDRDKAESVNRLLVVGFWLTNLGYVALNLRIGRDVPDLRTAIEALATKLGGVAIILGLLHFGVLFVLGRIRHGRRMEKFVRAPYQPYQPFQPMPPTTPAPAR